MGVRNWTRRGKSVSEDEESGSIPAVLYGHGPFQVRVLQVGRFSQDIV